MEINKCEDLKNFFIADSVLYTQRKWIGLILGAILLFILQKLDKQKRTKLHVLIAVLVALAYILLIDKVLNFLVNMRLDKDEQQLKNDLINGMVENCKVIFG